MSDQKSQSRHTGMMRRRAFLKVLGVTGGSLVVVSHLPRSRAWAQARAAEPTPRYGGTLRYGILSAPAHFDVHQSGTVANMAAQGPMYDNLIRRDPRDGQTIIADLAQRWEVAPDGKTYTFFLRQGVKFHDGADFTAEDVHATYSRMVWPPKGVSIPRTPLFSAVSEIRIIDPYTIAFHLSEPRPVNFMLGAFASGWNIIVRKKTLEENEYSLRKVENFPGTGPFRHVRRVDKEVWVMEKNPHYWNKGLPYLDRLEIYHIPPWTADVGAALIGGKVDYVRTIDPVAFAKVKTMPGLSQAQFYQSVIHAVWVNNTKKPLEDQAKRPGYQRDATAAIKDARRLLADAGYAKGLKGVDFMVRELAHHKLWSTAIQAMLKEALNIESTLRTVQTSVWFDEAQAGNYDLTISAIVSTLMDPSDYFNSWYARNGPQNYSRWHNDTFEGLLRQIDRELDDTRRKALIRQAEDLMEQDPPLLPVAYETMNDAWYSYVKGMNPTTFFGIYDVVRWDNVWLDK
jgi:ABC-type transport system substrate-binding protein